MRRTLLVALSWFAAAALPARSAAQVPSPGGPDRERATYVVLGHARVPAPLPVRLPRMPELRAGPSAPAFPDWPDRLALSPPGASVAPVRALTRGPAAELEETAPDSVVRAEEREAPILIPEAVQEFADLGLRVQGRGELGGAWIRYRPCDPTLRFNCDPGLFPRIQPDVQFGVQVGGTISDRVHIDVDWDQRREFDATNNINVYYEGLPGEVLQRIEVGDVSLELPRSRYLTRGIPAGNFGFKGTGRLGAMDVQAVWTQQKGDVASREFRMDAGADAGLVQDARIVLDDAEYVRGQFFFAVDPAAIVGAPHFDPLRLVASDAPPTLRPRPGGLALYRDEGAVAGNFQEQAQQGYFLADGVASDGVLRHSGLFRPLEPGQDYIVHPSGLWFMLRVPLRPDEALAVAYVTESGDTVGTPGAESLPPGSTPVLRLVRGPGTIHQPNQPTWDLEMHQVYRFVASSGVELSSVELSISLGQEAAGITFKEVRGRRVPFLRLFGLDENAPVDRVDEARIFRPSDLAGLETSGAIRGTFVVFPTLAPFGRPPPVPSEGLTAAENAAVIGTDANTAIYELLDPVERRNAAQYRLNFDYRVRSEGLASTFNLGAFGIRPNSERITVDGRLLVRGVDYVIDYDLGTVTLLNPQRVLGASRDAEIRATWEQQPLFQLAPTTVFGLSSRYDLGGRGEINVVGMYQSERTLMTRPQLGTEPGAVLLGGASARYDTPLPWLDAALAGLAGRGQDTESRLDLTSEVALSVPDPNTRGATYLDDFESTDELPLSLEQQNWRLGSVPQDDDGAPDLPWPLGLRNATPLVWQDRYLSGGREVGFLQPQQIDQQINIAGARLAERALYLTVGDPSRTGSDPRWRSIVTSLSPSGLDLSRSEFLEFYVGPLEGGAEATTLIFDIGTVGEDAFYYDLGGNLAGITDEGIPWGEGVLDEEARLAQREVWGPEADARGLWDQECEADRLNPVPLGDRRANCTRNNGRPDTEDLNGNGVLDDADGPYHRYAIRLDAVSPYLVRTQHETGTAFRLYRIPLRGATATAVNGASAATWRFVKHLRITVVSRAPGVSTLALARLRITGSRWAKRSVHGVLDGQTGSDEGLGSATTAFQVGSVSRLTEGADYRSPEGVREQVPDPTQAIGASGVEFNERGLKLTYTDLEPDERAEVYFRYPQQPRSFLQYGQLRLYGLAYRGDWGFTGSQALLVKVGTDAENYYLYRTRLKAGRDGGAVQPADWLPELVIDFEQWYALRAEAERVLSERGPSSEPVEVWSVDSTYAVVLQDRARGPNLAAVREISFAVHNGRALPSSGEVWLNDVRLGGAVTEPGLAGRLEMDLNAGDLLDATLELGAEGGRYQQLNAAPDYQRALDVSVAATARLGRLAPESWGVAIPLSVSYGRTGTEPIFLESTDVVAERLPSLRPTRATHRRVGVALRKTTPASNPWVGAVVNGLALRAGYATASTSRIASARDAVGVDGAVSYDRRPADVRVDIVPSFVTDALRALVPRAVEESEFFQGLADASLRLTPERVALSTAYRRQEDRTFRYTGILALDGDREVEARESPREALENRASVTLRPFESVTAALSVISARDLLDPARATTRPTEQAALERAQGGVAGLDLGWERDRTLASELSVRPRIASWLRPSLSYTGRFRQRRTPAYVELQVTGADTTALLQRTFHGERRLSRGLMLEPGALSRAVLGTPDEVVNLRWTDAIVRVINGAAGRLLPAEFTWDDGISSRFERELASPDLGYQLGLGGQGAFRRIDGDTAAAVILRDGFRARTGLRLPGQARLEVGYGETRTTLDDLRAGERAERERRWPEIRLDWQDVPVPETWSFLESATVTSGLTRTRRLIFIDAAGAPVERVARELTLPIRIRLMLGGGLNFTYGATVTTGDGTDPTGGSERDAATHSLAFGGRFLAPPALQDRFPRPIGVSVRYDYQADQQCRLPAVFRGEDECTPYVDFLNRTLDLTLDTDLSDLNVGLRLSYTDRRSFVGTRAGSSQFQLGLFGQFDFAAGTTGGGIP